METQTVATIDVGTAVCPKLRLDVSFLPTSDGVMFRTGKGVFSIKGPTVYPLVSTLLPIFDGTHTIADVCQSLAPSQRDGVEQLLHTLLERGVLQARVAEPPDLLGPEVRRRFDRQLTFIEHFADRPLWRFRQFRTSRILVCGHGVPAACALVSLARNGLETLHAAVPDGESERRAVENEIRDLSRAGVSARLVHHALDAAPLDEFDYVAYCSSTPSLKEVASLHERCRRDHRGFLAGLVLGSHSYIGPFAEPGGAACWMCAFLRVASNSSPSDAIALWRSLTLDEPLATPAVARFVPGAQILGNNVAFELFKQIGGHIAPEARGSVIVQSLETLETDRVPIARHPLCPLCAGRPGTGPDWQPAREHATQTMRPFMHGRAGIFHGFNDDELVQLPLRVSSIEWSDPASGEPLATLGFHQDSTFDARRDALAAASRRYAWLAVAPNRFERSSYDRLRQDGAAPVAPHELVTSSGGPSWAADRPTEWVLARSLGEDRERPVPAAAVYPLSSLNLHGLFERAAVGASSGIDARRMLRAGLLSALAYERLRRHTQGAADAVLVEHDAPSAIDRDAAHLVRYAERFGRQVRILELAGDGPGRVALAGVVDRDTSLEAYALGAGVTMAEAVIGSLVQLVGGLQMTRTPGELGHSAAELFPGFALHPDVRREPAAYDSAAHTVDAPEPAADDDTSALIAQTLDAGFAILVADTTPCDLTATKTVVCGTVLLARHR